MPDLKQALRDFVATANSGKYADENVLLSKFPELKGYDVNVLKDFVATSNSGKYQNEDELFSKFPEFSTSPLKKKEDTLVSKLDATLSESPKPSNQYGQQLGQVPTAKLKQQAPLVLTEEERATYVPPAPTPQTIQKPENALDIYAKDTSKPSYANLLDNSVAEMFKNSYEFGADVLDGIKNWSSSNYTTMLSPTFAPDAIKEVINSSLPQETKNSLNQAITASSQALKNRKQAMEQGQIANPVPDNVVSKGIVTIAGMIPDLAAAEFMPASAEATFGKRISPLLEKASPYLKKYIPKAADLIDRSVNAAFTKVMAIKGAAKGAANVPEGGDTYLSTLEGGLKGIGEGMYMHGLGEAAGVANPTLAKAITKAGVNTAVATTLSLPLANAGVFTTARALRTPLEQGRAATPDELAQEAFIGIGFSLPHLATNFATQNEANNYYDNILKTDDLASLGRVVNETKDNLDLAYNPDTNIQELETARDKMKVDILAEPDLKVKKEMGDAAIILQNQIDAKKIIDGLVANKDNVVEDLKNNNNLSDEEKNFFIAKTKAIVDAYDTSEGAVKKRELNQSINDAQKELDDASQVLSTSTSPSDRIQAKIRVDDATVKLQDLNDELVGYMTETPAEAKVAETIVDFDSLKKEEQDKLKADALTALTEEAKASGDELVNITDEQILNKAKEDYNAIQKQTTNEGVLRTEQPQVGLQEVGKGNEVNQVVAEEAKPTQEVDIISSGDVVVSKSKYSANPSFEDMLDFNTNGGRLEIGKVNNAKNYGIIELYVDEDKRNQGIATKLLQKALDETKGNLSGMASNDKAVALNYKLGMRAFDENGKELSLEKTKKQRAEYSWESIRMILPENKIGVNYKPFKEVVSAPTEEVSLKTQEQAPTTTKTVEQEVAELNSILEGPKEEGTKRREIYDNVVKSIKGVFPDLDIQSFDTVAEMVDFGKKKYGDKVLQNVLGDVGGVILFDENRKPIAILTNKESSDVTTMPHEAWHAVLIKGFGNDQKLFTEFRSSVDSILRESGYADIADELSDFSDTKEYIEAGTPSEEWLVQLGALLTSADITREGLTPKSKTLLTKLKELINKFAERIIGEPVFLENATPRDVLDFMVAISNRMSRGENINDFFKEQEKKATNEFKKPINEVKKHIVGESASLSAVVRRYKDVAEKLEKEGVDELEIKIATGWERGADGNWKYELPSGKLKDIDVLDLKLKEDPRDGKKYPTAKLGDIFSSRDLYSAYDNLYKRIADKDLNLVNNLPKLGDVPVIFKVMDLGSRGSFNPFSGIITLNRELFDTNRAEMELVLIHEIQHYIQEVEGFEKGSNPNRINYLISNKKTEIQNIVKDLKTKYEFVKKYHPEDKETIKDLKNIILRASDAYRKFDEISKYKGDKYFGYDKVASSLERAYDLYQRVGGEVEANNAADRSKMTTQQRRNKLIKDTEKVAVEDQIFFKDKEEIKDLKAKLQRNNTNTIDGIIKIGLANGFSDEAIKTVLKNRGFEEAKINDAFETTKEAAKKVEVTPEFAKGYDTLKEKLAKEYENYIKLVDDKDKGLKFIMTKLKTSDVYQNATDVQKEKMVRDIRSIAGKKEKSAPSVEKLFGTLKDVTKITMTESKALIEQIKNKARGAKEAKSIWRATSQELSRSIKEAKKGGRITANQAANIIRQFSKVDMFNTESIKKFVDYTQKVWNDAEYADKLNTAKSDKKDISKLSRNKDKDANLRQLGKQFLDIDPSMVDDINKYNEVASEIKESLRGSKIVGQKINVAGMVNIEQASKYIDETMKTQREKQLQDRIENIQELMGVDASEFSYEDMIKLLDPEAKINKYDEGIIRTTINKMFDTYSSIIDSMLSEGKDAFTGEEFEVSKTKRELVKNFMDMDLNMLTPKQSLEAVDALNNFIQNKSTAKMDAVFQSYEGNKATKELANSGVESKPLQMYWNKDIGKFFAEQFTTLPVLFERMFKGVTAGDRVQKASGVTELINKKAKAEREANDIFEDYMSNFFKSKANGKEFTSESNIIERGLVAFMSRNVIGTEEQVSKEFQRRKKLIEESIDVLSKGSDNEKKKAELYQESYDKLLKDSSNSKELRGKAAKENIQAVDYWVKKWADKYDELADVSENIYNTILDKDTDFNPDKYSKLESTAESVNLVDNESAFLGNTNALYKKETGVLMKATKPTELPRSDNGRVDRYVDLSFDKNNSNSMYDALIDLNTAAPIRKIEAFLNSPDITKVIPEVKDEKLLKDRIKLYIRNLRNKNVFDNDEFASIVRKLNTISSIGVGQALGGVLQPVKQIIPVAMNTLVNAGGLDINSMFNSEKNKFIDDSGYAISNRGIESLTNISSVNKLIDLASQSTGQKALKYIEKANKFWLDAFLVKPDVFIARASWMTYYEKYLKSHGENTKDIDYKTHELNKDAADYAQNMVDRQQNTSDADLQGKIFSSKNPATQIIVKTVLPFANFRMNQTMRMMSDVSTLTSKTSSIEDKKIAAKSLSGFAVEMATFKLVAMGASILLGSITKQLMGKKESEEDKKKRINNAIKAQLTSTATDILSPLPISDTPVAIGANFALDKVQDAMNIADKDKLALYEGTQSDAIKNLGTLGISAGRAKLLYDLSMLSYTGKYKDSFGNERKISEKDRETLKAMVGLSLMTNVGLAPVEANTIATDAMKYAKQAKSKSGMNMTELKRYFPDDYQEQYGEGSAYREAEQYKKEIKNEQKQIKQEAMDAAMGYEPKPKKKK